MLEAGFAALCNLLRAHKNEHCTRVSLEEGDMQMNPSGEKILPLIDGNISGDKSSIMRVSGDQEVSFEYPCSWRWN